MSGRAASGSGSLTEPVGGSGVSELAGPRASSLHVIITLMCPSIIGIRVKTGIDQSELFAESLALSATDSESRNPARTA